MNERININGIKVWATLKKRDYMKKWYCDDKAHRVNVFTIHMERGNERVRFTFYDNIINCSHGIVKLNADALKDAVACILADCISGNRTFEDFCSESCFDPQDYGAMKIYSACINQLRKLTRIMSEQEIYEVYNNLNA